MSRALALLERPVFLVGTRPIEYAFVVAAWEYPVVAAIGLVALVLAVVVAVGVSEWDARHPPQKGQP